MNDSQKRFPGRALSEEEAAASWMVPPTRFRAATPVPAQPMKSIQIGDVKLSVGDVLDLEDADYKYGEGDITIEVQAIFATTYGDGAWLEVFGAQRMWNGTVPRTVQVKVAAIPRSLHRGKHRGEETSSPEEGPQGG